MNFDLPTPFDEWEEPVYRFIKVEESKIFLAQDVNALMWAEATNPESEAMIMDLIENSVWTPYAIMALCESEGILYGMFYMRFWVDFF